MSTPNLAFDVDAIEAQDDLDVQLDPATYQDAQPRLPIYAGNYGVKIKDMDFAKDAEGNVTLNGGYPSVVIKQVEVIEGQEKPEAVYLYQRVNIKPRKRKNFTTGEESMVSDLADLVRSGDANASFSGWKEAVSVLQGLVAQGTTFYFKLDWEASDRDAIKEHVDALKAEAEDENDPEVKKAVAAVYKKYTRRGQNKFKAPNGKGYIASMPTEDGGFADARVVVTMDGFISQALIAQAGAVKIGPRFKAI